MGPIAARKALQIVTNAERVLAIELLSAAQALDFETEHATTKPLQAVRQFIRRVISRVVEDRALAPDFATATRWIRSGELVRAASKAGVEVR
jgi:histidine ammonia-lyase